MDGIIKQCTRCKSDKSVGEFYKRYGKPRSECKACTNGDNQAYAKANAEELRQKSAEYRRDNADKVKAAQAKYREENRDLCEERTREWKAANYDRHIAVKKQYYRDNRERLLEESKQYYIDNPHVRAMSEQRRRARKESVPSDFETQDWEDALDYFGNKCAYCRGTSDVLHQEHVVPLIKGGPYAPCNIIPACRTCNLDKFTHDMPEWFAKKAYYTEEALRKIERFVGEVARRSCLIYGVVG